MDVNERKPLLKHSTISGIPENSDESETEAFDLLSIRVPIYGTTAQPTSRIIPPNERITYTWNEINVFAKYQGGETLKTRVKNLIQRRPHDLRITQKHILKNLCGVAFPGELLAIMGSSGAGKTTLLNTITFQSPRNVTVSGLRCLNGKVASARTLTSCSAYVQQEDLFIGNLTVVEHLIFQALVRMDRDVTYAQRMQRVEEVIEELSLGQCRDTIIGVKGRVKGISGGEMKRLSFAAEVLTNPLLMFCDEPTSGLDSFMALNVIQVLKGLAQTGKTVVCTIHQPSSEIYAMFDKILLMSEGRTAFLGTPEEAELFFRELDAPCPVNYNPADYYIQALAIVPDNEESCRQAINVICDKFEQSDVGIKLALDTGNKETYYNDDWASNDTYRSPYKASWFAQFRAVLWRSFLSVIKEPLLIKVRFLQTLIISLIFGAIYYGQILDQNGTMNINGVLFLFLTNMTFQNVFAVVNVFCSELPVFLRENRNGMYRTDVYFLCKTLADSPVFIALPIIFTSISYYLIGLNPDFYRFLTTCAIMVLLSNVTTSFGYLISCASVSISMALSVGPPLVVPFMLFGGFFLNIESVPPYFEWLSYISWFRYGNEALMINQWQGVENITCTNQNLTCPSRGHVVLEIYNFNESDFTLDLAGLASLLIGFRLLAYIALLLKTFK